MRHLKLILICFLISSSGYSSDWLKRCWKSLWTLSFLKSAPSETVPEKPTQPVVSAPQPKRPVTQRPKQVEKPVRITREDKRDARWLRSELKARGWKPEKLSEFPDIGQGTVRLIHEVLDGKQPFRKIGTRFVNRLKDIFESAPPELEVGDKLGDPVVLPISKIESDDLTPMDRLRLYRFGLIDSPDEK